MFHLRRISLFLLILLLALALSVWWALRGSLAQLQGEHVLPTLQAPVTVERDALGTVTIAADNRVDVAFALGFVHAQERFFEMDLMRRSAAGELAELFGRSAVEHDLATRVHRARTNAGEQLQALDEAQRRLVDVYRDGVNTGLQALRTRPFPYLLLRSTPRSWASEDTLLVVHAMAFTLNDAANTRELGLARLHASLPPAAFQFLTAPGGHWDAPLSGPALNWPDVPARHEADLRDAESVASGTQATDTSDLHAPAPGSNSMAVHGALAGGAALVANDMHLDLRVPSIWFRTRLLYPHPHNPALDVDVSGASLPGTPAIVVGSNRHVAWGFTNSFVDTADWVRIHYDSADPMLYRTADGPARIEIHNEIIRVRDDDDVQLSIRSTRWGPILASDVDGTDLALVWTMQQPEAANLVLQELELAENADDAVAVAQRSGIPLQSIVIGDRAGNIAWTITGRLPRRIGDFDPLLPADWSLPGTGWDGWLEPNEYPLLANPPWQRMWPANQRLTQDPWLQRVGDGGYDLGARGRQIRDAMRARASFTPTDMLAIQLDDRAVFLTPWKQLLEEQLQRMEDGPTRTAMHSALVDWTGSADSDSVAYRAVRAWREQVSDYVLEAFTAPAQARFADFSMPRLPQVEHAVWALLQQRPLHLLAANWDDWDDLLDTATHEVVAAAQTHAGIETSTWGDANTASIQHPLSSGLPGFLARVLDMPAQPLSGDDNMPRVQRPSFGASERFAVAPGDEENGYFMMPGGQSGHPLSPFHGAGHDDWVHGRPTPFLPGETRYRLELLPASAD